MAVRLQAGDFDVGAEIRALTGQRTDIGAVVSFTGVARDFAGDKQIRSITLEHYPGMTETELSRIEKEAQARWPLLASLIVHRYGRLLPGDQIVLVITASTHRRAAFEAAEFLMDYLKTGAPFWKFEETGDGGDWVAAKDSDESAADRWK